MKLRALTYTKKGKLLSIAENLAKNSDYAADVIPPAYSCDRERVVIIVASVSKNMPDTFRRFCLELNKTKAQNIALIADGDEAYATQVLDWVRSAGSNVYDEILYIKGGLPFKFANKVSAEEEKAVKDWYEKLLANLG